MLSSIRPSFFLLPYRQDKKKGVPIYKKDEVDKNGVPYKLAIKKTTNGLLSKLFNTMVLPSGQKTGPGGYCTLIYMLSHIIKLQAVVKIVTNETKKCSI
jgi:hypothetical protein